VATPRIVGLAQSASHGFSKQNVGSIALLAGHGVTGDAHAGKTVKHRSRVAVDPSQPNLRQVHLIHSELLAELALKGFDIQSGQLGENILTQHLDVLALPRGTKLEIGLSAVVEATGLRNPCAQIDNFAPRLLAHLAYRDADRKLVRKAGIMSVVLNSGIIAVGDCIKIILPPEPHADLEPV